MLNRRELVKLALVSFAGLCLVVLLIYAGYLYSWSRSHCDLPGACGDQIPFDANLWRESVSLRDPQRIRMIDDLQARCGVSAYWCDELGAYLQENRN